jgi:hypothetical protein
MLRASFWIFSKNSLISLLFSKLLRYVTGS